MSDCFDHEMDAYEDNEARGDYGDGARGNAVYGPRLKSCRHCGESRLHWRHLAPVSQGWRLFNEQDVMHSCITNAPESSFPVAKPLPPPQLIPGATPEPPTPAKAATKQRGLPSPFVQIPNWDNPLLAPMNLYTEAQVLHLLKEQSK